MGTFTISIEGKSEDWIRDVIAVGCKIFGENSRELSILITRNTGKQLMGAAIEDSAVAEQVVRVARASFTLGFVKGVAVGQNQEQLSSMVGFIHNERKSNGEGRNPT